MQRTGVAGNREERCLSTGEHSEAEAMCAHLTGAFLMSDPTFVALARRVVACAKRGQGGDQLCLAQMLKRFDALAVFAGVVAVNFA